MSTPASNILLIKRRLPNSILGTGTLPLSGGELGYNEVNDTLYYGSSAGVVDIAGPGSYTRLTVLNSVSSSLQSQINSSTTLLQDVSGRLDTKIDAVSAGVDSLKVYSDNSFLAISGGNVTGKVNFHDNVTIFGNISASGSSYFSNTFYSTTSALSVVNIGNTGPALYVANNGTGDIASFYDLDTGIEVFHIGGNNGDFPNVGVKTSTPNTDLTVNGEISANGTIYGKDLYLSGILKVPTLSAQTLNVAGGKFTIDGGGAITSMVGLSGVNGVSYITDFVIDCGTI